MIFSKSKVFTKSLSQKNLKEFSKTSQISSKPQFKVQQYQESVKKMVKSKEISSQNPQIFRHQNYSFRILTENHRQSAINLLTDQFFDQEPLTNSYWRQFPQQKTIGKNFMFQLWSMLIQNCIQNRLSVCTVDLQKNQMVGICIAKDIKYFPIGFDSKFMKNLNVLSSVFALEQKMIQSIDQQHQLLLEKQEIIMDIFAVAIRKKHMGKKLFYKMVIGNEILALKQKFQYGFVYATNFKTEIAISKLNYQKISEIDCRQFQYFGVKPFCLVNEQNCRPTIWIKKLK